MYDDLKLIGRQTNDRRVRKLLAHAAEHRKLYKEIQTLRHDRDKYHSMVNKICHQMVTPVDPDLSQDELSCLPHRWKITTADGVFYEFDGLTQEEAEVVWRDAWELDPI